jgi:hypothetical protein
MLIVPVVYAANVSFAHSQALSDEFVPRKVEHDTQKLDDNGAAITDETSISKVSILNQLYIIVHMY